jgi:hypothetical protein
MKILNQQQIIRSIITGVVLWFVFVWVIRAIPWAFDGGVRSALLFVGTIPAAWLLVKIVRVAAGLEPATLFEGVVVATFAAMFLDGLVFTFVSHWYGNTETLVRFGAGYILWGAGMGILIAWLEHVHFIQQNLNRADA